VRKFALLVAVLFSVLGLSSSSAVAVETPALCSSSGHAEQAFRFHIWGESQHWALLLEGMGTCKEGRVYTAKALPWLVWGGGMPIPKNASVRFKVQAVTCIEGNVPLQDTKVVRVADCKLVYPGQASIQAERPDEVVRAITSTGDFTVTWNGMSEQITWRYGYPRAPQDANGGTHG
jgi:hypothetical protein